jgi:hypothetical protein
VSGQSARQPRDATSQNWSSAEQQEAGDLLPQSTDIKERHRTKRASGQFRSPLLDKSLSGASSIRLTPTIQSLERQLQHLRQAVKIKRENDTEILKSLITKWVDAGRDVAWEVWDLVKANANQGTMDRSNGSLNSWGWAEDVNQKDHRDSNGTLTEEKDHDMGEEGNRKQDSLGTMLLQLGIAHEVLGWNEDEGTFC